MDNNLFTNKTLFYKHFNLESRLERLEDFQKIYNILKNHLIPEEKAQINEEKLHKYVNMYKEENRQFIKNILNLIIHIPFDKFLKDSIEEVELFNKRMEKHKKYVYIIGVNSKDGSDDFDFDIYKSNLWMFMLMYEHLKIKPFDILLNLKIAIKLYGDEYEFLIVDDCMYSGTQMLHNVLYLNSVESLFRFPKSFLATSEISKPMFEPVKTHNITVNLIIPYASISSLMKICRISLMTALNIIKYNKYVIKSFNELLSYDDLDKLYLLYNNFYRSDTSSLIPIIFDHKISDNLSTIELVLIKGQVLDDPNKRLVFIDACEYDKNKKDHEKYNYNIPNYNMKNIECPTSPYHNFEKILKEKLK